jgi:transcriptional regulator with XRE-family HTH domain
MQNRIRDLRERARLTQTELATLLGVDETAVSRWESGSRPLTPTVLARLAKVFKVETWELLVDRKGLRRLAAGADQGAAEISVAEDSER